MSCPKRWREDPEMISRLFSREPETRVFFATDIHGSEVCWKKFLNSGKHYEAKILILGGDMTGKALVPIVEQGAGRWKAELLENRYDFTSEDEVKEFEQAVGRRGYYPSRTTPDEIVELGNDEKLRDELFHEKMLGTVERWMQMADEKLEGTDMQCFVSPGNDDQFEVDEIIAAAKRVQLAEGRVVEFGDYQMVSTGWSNRTPWDTYREEDEEDLKKRLDQMTSQVTAPPERTIYNFHCPPYGTGLDDAPELTEDLRPKHGGRSIVPVGSTAVKEAIEEGQPALSLHGHIHEARGNTRIGRTLAINPGSSYEQGQLLGAMIDLDGKQKVKRFILTSG
jgi:Icc-related predicted phosphoesterase